MEIENIEKLFTTYWSQTTLILAFISFFGKKVFDLITKKKEINHNLFQQHKIKATHDFITSYSQLVHAFHNLEYYKIFNEEIKGDLLDNLITNPISDFCAKNLILTMYSEEKLKVNLMKIEENFLSIDDLMKDLLFDLSEQNTTVNKPIFWSNFMKKKLDENKKLISHILDLQKAYYK